MNAPRLRAIDVNEGDTVLLRGRYRRVYSKLVAPDGVALMYGDRRRGGYVVLDPGAVLRRRPTPERTTTA